jgi:hypothetical protein
MTAYGRNERINRRIGRTEGRTDRNTKIERTEEGGGGEREKGDTNERWRGWGGRDPSNVNGIVSKTKSPSFAVSAAPASRSVGR